MKAAHFDDAVFVQPAEAAADRLQHQPQVARDLVAAHRQLEVVRRAADAAEPLAQAVHEQGHALTGLLLTYPVHQACDILFCKANVVPIGKDNLPHVEITRTIARRFNERYAKKNPVFPEPSAILSEAPEIPGLDGRKMSKSLGNCIYLAEEPEDIKKKVMSMFTDPNHLRVEDPGKVEGNPVFIYLDAFCRDEYFAEFWNDYSCLDELKAHYQRGGLGDVKVKKFLNNVMQAELGPIRARRKEWEQRIPDVMDILKEGSRVAEAKAAQTLNDVKASMRINYFDSDQSDMYQK